MMLLINHYTESTPKGVAGLTLVSEAGDGLPTEQQGKENK